MSYINIKKIYLIYFNIVIKENLKDDELVNKFTALQSIKPKLVLYTAPTGTGKTQLLWDCLGIPYYIYMCSKTCWFSIGKISSMYGKANRYWFGWNCR